MTLSLVKNELLKYFLSGRSTVEVSRSLGYSFDQVRRWQMGTKELKWNEFCRLCVLLGVPLKESVEKTLTVEIGSNDDLDMLLVYYRKRMADSVWRELPQTLAVHPSVIKRYFLGQVSPNIEFIFALFNLEANLLSAFILGLTGKKELSHLHGLFSESQSQPQVEARWPIAAAIEGLLATEEYCRLTTHQVDWFCTKLRVSPQYFNMIWSQLLKRGHIIEQSGKYVRNYKTINTQGIAPHEICKMVEFWTERARQRFLAPDHQPINNGCSKGLVTYRIVPMSRDTATRVSEIMLRANQEVLALVESSQGPYDDVRVVLQHHFSVTDISPEPLSTLQNSEIVVSAEATTQANKHEL